MEKLICHALGCCSPFAHTEWVWPAKVCTKWAEWTWARDAD